MPVLMGMEGRSILRGKFTAPVSGFELRADMP